ncbi:LacI family DNA-binding transcriptional regulator [Pedobacter sp. P351]|uniref:LacI family DNA-binding transcriptional regulator n=1 Tax=Pedobacter superstes TaxID=3133441 RepID=UPI0030A1BDFA
MRARTTLIDIAKKLNITPATVSRALSNHPEISAKTKKLVNEMAIELDYKKNNIASSLRLGKTHVIGVLIPTAEHIFFGSVIHGITNLANRNGYDVLIYQSNETEEYEIKGINAFISARVDGILVSIAKNTRNYSHFKKAQYENIPIAFFDRNNDDLGIPSVVVDDFQGAYKATEHLIQNGYKRIAHISGPQHIKIFRERLRGYAAALAAYEMQYDSDLVYEGDVSIESGKTGVSTFLKLDNPPDAIFGVEDITALGVIKELKTRNIKVPEEVGVFGFCNDLFGEHITPALSTIDQQTIVMGEEAFKLIHNMIVQGHTTVAPSKIVLEPIMIIRDSSIKQAKPL